MEITNYKETFFKDVFDVVHKTIKKIYPKFYPRGAVDFFHNHHSQENMKKKLPNEFTLVLFDKGKLFGTGTLFENEIKRFFILPEYQGKGYGKILLAELEKNIDKNKYDKYVLDSSLGAVKFYQKSGYFYKDYKTIKLPDDTYLCYLVMEKDVSEKWENNGSKIYKSYGS